MKQLEAKELAIAFRECETRLTCEHCAIDCEWTECTQSYKMKLAAKAIEEQEKKIVTLEAANADISEKLKRATRMLEELQRSRGSESV